jgi:potassium-transporting ATPase potassium-binding subunit
MGDTLAGLLTAGSLIAALGLTWWLLGDHLFRTFTSTKHWRVERGAYRLLGVDGDAEQTWVVYLRSLLAFSLVGVLVLYALLRLQDRLPLDIGMAAVAPSQAFETAASFVTNTNWQSYAGEATMSHLSQMAGLAVQNFLSAAVGIAVAVALVRGFTRSRTDRIGSFWVDLVRGLIRVLVPLSLVAAVALVAAGAVQNLTTGTEATTLAGATQTLVGGPVASQEAIKDLGTNGGGFYNANSAHPFENPTPLSNWIEIYLLLAIPVALTRTLGRMVGSVRQGVAVLGVMAALLGATTAGIWVSEANPSYDAVPAAVGSTLEGKEQRFGVEDSLLFASATTGTSTGSVNSFHDSYSSAAGGLLVLNMALGEVAPGGVGAGLYGLLVLATLSVFLAGLMVGRTPELLGKKIGPREVKHVALYVLATPAVLLVGAALAIAVPDAVVLQDGGAHGLTEVLYAWTSAANNNGSAFAGLTTATTFGNTCLGIVMLVGRFVPIALVLGLAGSLARQQSVPVTAGTLPTAGPLFVGLVCGVVVIVAGLTYLPVLALGPLAEALS